MVSIKFQQISYNADNIFVKIFRAKYSNSFRDAVWTTWFTNILEIFYRNVCATIRFIKSLKPGRDAYE